MPNRMELPEELTSLIEKREQEDQDRRKDERRLESNTSEAPQGEERRSPSDRREIDNRRES